MYIYVEGCSFGMVRIAGVDKVPPALLRSGFSMLKLAPPVRIARLNKVSQALLSLGVNSKN
jgi:hypothetical protein